MPWMIFYQQSAVLDKKLPQAQSQSVRWDTAIGSMVTQFVMIAVVVMVAATIGRTNPGRPLDPAQETARHLMTFSGTYGAKVVFGMGVRLWHMSAARA